ncbi:glycosyltransferase family 2 protein [Candidatus Parcubacteria bacterium]|nr:glycosyltransferase family 2 protein [Candidatus Parcubacteria bacterium]
MKVSVVCPVFNEEKTVKTIAKVLRESEFLDEVLFADDGSRDRTFEILKKFESERIKILRLKENRGKSFALFLGIKNCQGEIVVFLDGDLLGLKKEHLASLVFPLFQKRARYVIGVPTKKFQKIVKPWEIYLSGERAYFKADLIPYLKKFPNLGYGIEVFLNFIFPPKDGKIVFLRGLISPSKFKKRTKKEAVKEYLKETKEVFKASANLKISPKWIFQIFSSYLLAVKEFSMQKS